MTTVQSAVESSIRAAKIAEALFIEKQGEPSYCGFAWVEVTVDRTNSKEAKELLAAGFKRDYKARTLTLWNPGGLNTQSMEIKEVGSHACAEVLRNYGFRANAYIRAD